MIDISVGGPLAGEQGHLLGIPVLADLNWGPGGDWVVDVLGATFEEYVEASDFTGSVGQTLLYPAGTLLPFSAVVLIGLGAEADLETVRQGAGLLGRAASGFRDVATTLHHIGVEGSVGAVVEGFMLGQYRFDKYRSEPKPPKTERLRLVGSGDEPSVEELRRGVVIAEAVSLARDLVNEPAGGKSPEMLSDLIVAMGDEHGFGVRVYDRQEIEEEGFGGLLGVAAGAHNPPRMVVMDYEPEEVGGFLALVGKGIVFDSGGLSIKPASNMETMKTDMSGAAAVIGAVRAIAELQIPIRVLAVTPLTENMPGGGAQRPGDVLTARNGKTIEVLNTDAEGRLVLADGLSLAAEAGPDLIVDLATLTGACHVALGDKIAGLFSNDEASGDLVRAAGASVGERLWPLPVPSDYRRNIDSEIADMKNVGNNRYGGAINAALLLQEFVDDRPWVHLDIAGPARWPEDEHYQSKGGSGFGVRTLVALADLMASAR
jgi:leucyl aminopeptidase